MYHTAQHRAEILVPGVQTYLNGIANKGNVVLVKGEFFTCSYALLQFHQTDGMAAHPDDTLGDPVLDLDTWIDFEKVGFPLLINQKLDCGRAAQDGRPCQGGVRQRKCAPGLPGADAGWQCARQRPTPRAWRFPGQSPVGAGPPQ